MKRRTKLQWYEYHKTSAENKAEERVRKQYQRGFDRYEGELQRALEKLSALRATAPLKEKILSILGVHTEFQKDNIYPLEREIEEINGKLCELKDRCNLHVKSERRSSLEFYEYSRQRRKEQLQERQIRRVERNTERRIRYFERMPKLRQAGRALKRWLLKGYGENMITCHYCGKLIDGESPHLEHKTPISRGGSNHRTNLAIACASCNLKKGRKTEAEFRNDT